MSVVTRADSLYKRDKDHWGEIYQKAENDLRFMGDDLFAQWDEQDAENRYSSGRPVLTIDQLGQFVHQVVNDIRMNTPTIGVIPAGGESSQETAEIFKGLIKNIEYNSQADDAYDMAADFSVRSSIGFITVSNDYVDNESFEQELRINRVIDPSAIYIDSESMEIDGRDAKHGFINEPILVEDFKEKWPDKAAVSFGDEKVRECKDGEYINICKFYEVEEEEKEVALTSSGDIVEYADGMEYKAKRKLKKRRIKCYLLSGADELEKSEFPGKYIPIVPVYGEEMWYRGKRNLHSLIRKSKDAQRMYNYWKSLETELLMKQPKAPIMVAEGQIEDYAEDWKNPDKAMALRYKTTDAKGQPAPPPQRLEPPVIPTGIVNASRETVDDIKATMGIYNASLGMASNETSGIAIARRQEEGSVATYHFADNLNKSIAHVGRILVCAIPEVYNTQRVIRIIDEEENPQQVGINGAMTDKQEMAYDLTQGKYDVRIIPGAAYTTRRQEAAEFFTQLVTQRPELLEVMGDLMFKNMDFSGAPAMAKRMEKIIDPKFLDEEEEQPDPEKEQMAQLIEAGAQEMEMMKQTIMQLQEQLKSKQEDNVIKAQEVARKAEEDRRNHEIKMMELQIEANKNAQDASYKERELALKERAIELKEAEIIAKDNLQRQQMMLDAMQSEQEAFREESAAHEGAETQHEGTENV